MSKQANIGIFLRSKDGRIVMPHDTIIADGAGLLFRVDSWEADGTVYVVPVVGKQQRTRRSVEDFAMTIEQRGGKRRVDRPARGLMQGVNHAAVALAEAVQKMDRSTGSSHAFVVHCRKADGTDAQVQQVSIIALTWGDAWALMGDAVLIFMNKEHGRFVTAIHADPVEFPKLGGRPG